MIQKTMKFLKSDIVFTLSMVIAALSCLITPPNIKYLDYIDYNTLILLFCLMLIMEGLKELEFFQFMGKMVLGKVKTERGIVFTLVFLCFISSMLITNDVALITFIPFGILIMEMAGMTSLLCLTITLMTIAGNLGSMLTPIGNPQNLYLFSVFHMNIKDFLLLLLPYSIVSAGLIFAFIVLKYRKLPITISLERTEKPENKKVCLYLLLFILCLLAISGIISKGLLLIMVSFTLLIKNRHLFLKADYPLLFTFIFFFIFIGNINNLAGLHKIIIRILANHERIVSIGMSQIISNVPAAVLLSNYTADFKEIIIGTNLGGLGTLIASMASLISYKQIAGKYPHLKKDYLKTFTIWNLIFLILLYTISVTVFH